MAIERRKLYEKNKIGYSLVLLYIILNVVFSIYMIRSLETTYEVGIFIMTTIVLLLLGFLTAVKVQNYSMGWSITAIVIGLFQFVRMTFTDSTTVLTIFLVVSGVLCIAGGIVSVGNTKIRRKCVKDYNKLNSHTIK